MQFFIKIHSYKSQSSISNKTMHKAYFVVCLYLLVFGTTNGDREITIPIIHTSFEPTTETSKRKAPFCPNEILDGGDYGKFIFPETEANEHGVMVKVECPFGFRNDGLQVFYGEQQQTQETKLAESGAIRSCFAEYSLDNTSYIGKWHPTLNETPINYCKREGWDTVLENWNAIIETITPSKFRNLNPTMEELLQYAYTDYDCALSLINGIDKLLRNPSLGPDNVTQEERDHVLSKINKYTKKIVDILPPGFKTQVGDGGIVVETAKFYWVDVLDNIQENDIYSNLQPYVTAFNTLEKTDVRVGISAQALQMSMKNNFQRDPKLTITAYSDDIFSVWNNISTKNDKIMDPNDTNLNQTIPENCTSDATEEKCSSPFRLWGVLTIELDGIIQNLSEPIEFIIVSNEKFADESQVKCVYWDNETQNWSTKGLQTVEIANGVKCKSTHLTAFSALIEPLPLPFPGAEYAPINNSVHSFILSVLSSIGSICSIVGLSLTLLTYGLFRSLRRERSNRILINLSSSLLLMHIMSVSGSKSLWDGRCFIPAASLHYLVLSSLAWMMVEAVHMFELLISVFVRPENRFLIKRILLAWGIPVIIVGVCTVFEPEVYSVGRADLCLMSAHENIVMYYVAYIGPICIMLLVNIIIFGRIFRVLYQQTKRTKGTPRCQFVKISPSQIKGATTVLVLLGIGWVIGLLAIGPFEVLFRYMYCICNAGQGLFIFIFRVILNPHATKQWKQVILGLSSDSSLEVSVTSSTSSGTGKGKKRKSTVVSPTFISASNSVENSLTPSNPLTNTLAATVASILRSEELRAAKSGIHNEK